MTAVHKERRQLIKGVGIVKVVTVDFTDPEYQVAGFETTVTLPNGQLAAAWGPDNDETPAELHAAATRDLVEKAVREFVRPKNGFTVEVGATR